MRRLWEFQYILPSPEAAACVATVFEEISDGLVFVEVVELTNKDRERGEGTFGVDVYGTEDGIYSEIVSDFDAIELALADALRKHEPQHPLLELWYLKPENRHLLKPSACEQ